MIRQRLDVKGVDPGKAWAWFVQATRMLTAADFCDFTIRKEILWQSDTATGREVNAKEVEFIRSLRANDPAVGYNRWPRFRARS